MPIVSVTGPLAHDVVIEGGALARLGDYIAAAGLRPGTKLHLAEDANVVEPHGAVAAASLNAAGFSVTRSTLEADERVKTMPAVEALWSAALAARLGRGDAFVALGGGLVGDVVGFAAASYLRGIAVVQVPTTLLAMVDASTGGKTGVNVALPAGASTGSRRPSLGKNLAGAFWPPRVVIADPATLRTLPPRELSSGLAECVKHAVIDGVAHLDFLEAILDRVLALDEGAIGELVARSVAVKAAIVGRDPREAGERAILNLGHTFAHAFETYDGLDLTHGEAVAIGLVAAAKLAVDLGDGDAAFERRVRELLRRARLPVAVTGSVDATEVLRRMGFDKKSESGSARFVVPSRSGPPRCGVQVPEPAIRAALRTVGVP